MFRGQLAQTRACAEARAEALNAAREFADRLADASFASRGALARDAQARAIAADRTWHMLRDEHPARRRLPAMIFAALPCLALDAVRATLPPRYWVPAC